MEEYKRKEIEAKLFKMMAKTNKREDVGFAATKVASGVKVIRRRKGNPDTHIA